MEAIEEQNKKLKEIAWFQSHVVRAPLARLMGLADLIKEESAEEINPAELNQLLNYIINSARELDNVLNEIVKKTDEVEVTK